MGAVDASCFEPKSATEVLRRGVAECVRRGGSAWVTAFAMLLAPTAIAVAGQYLIWRTGAGELLETMRKGTLDPRTLGLSRASVEDLRGGDPEASARIARAVLEGEPGPRRDVVLLNAGAALEVAGIAGTLPEAMSAAARAIDSGAAFATLDRWVAASQRGSILPR